MPQKKSVPTRQTPLLRNRPLLPPTDAAILMGIFKVLANDTRLRLLHALVKSDELCVTDLAARVDMKPQAVSNQLQRLVDRGILGFRRDGNNIYYRVVDSCVVSILDLALCLSRETRKRSLGRVPGSERVIDRNVETVSGGSDGT